VGQALPEKEQPDLYVCLFYRDVLGNVFHLMLNGDGIEGDFVEIA